MSDSRFKPAAVAGPQPDHSADEQAPQAGPADVVGAVSHLLAGHEQLVGMIEHLAALLPASGLGASIDQLRGRLDAARIALFPPAKP